MGNRLTKIYTRTGDSGSTGMADGSRIEKSDLLVHAIGELDELNSSLAVLICHLPDIFIADVNTVQHGLFDAGAELAMREAIIRQDHVDHLEQRLDFLNQDLPPLKEFILPGGGLAASSCHVSRAVCRRTERALVALNQQQALNRCLLAYINRLSDYLFVLARAITRMTGEDEVYWQSERLRSTQS